MDRQIYKKMRDRIDKNLDSIEQLFNACLVKLNANEGFFGCEDLEGNISIVVNKGTYLHLNKNSGFTGTVYCSKKAAICVMTDPMFKQTGRVLAEMAAPVLMEGMIIGVVLLDRIIPVAFTEDDLSLLTQYAKRLGDILGRGA